MNMNKIINALKKNTSISAWKVKESTTESVELFYVQTQLETNRASSTSISEVTVYVDQENKRGSSSFKIYPYMNEEEIEKEIQENAQNALKALNPFYELPKVEANQPKDTQKELGDFKTLIERIKVAVFKGLEEGNGYLAATEFFLYKRSHHFMNSNGVDLQYVTYQGQVELIPSWDENGEEVEIYSMLDFSDVDEGKITSDVRELMKEVKDRCLAEKYHFSSVANVILQDQEVDQFLNTVASDLSYRYKFTHTNKTELGESIQGKKVTGDKLNISLLPFAKGASNSRMADDDGVLLKPTEIIADGIAKARFGSYQYGYYLEVKEPTGNLPILEAKAGNSDFASFKKEPYLRCVKLSGLQVDPDNNYFGGEVRLGYYFDGEKEIPVTGFSIQGNFEEGKANLRLSKECVTLPSYVGPKYLYFPKMKVA